MMLPNLVHLHLLLNHWPIIGTFIAVGMYLVALLAKSYDLTKATLVLFALMALFSIPAYLTGNLAQIMIQGEPGVSQSIIETHQGAALVAFIALEITGGFAWVGVWQFRRDRRLARWTRWTVLVSSIVTVGFIIVTGSTGGAIRHPEIISGKQTASVVGTLGSQLFAATQYVMTDSSRWVWPVIETLHFVGLSLLLGAVGILNLRMLGLLKQLPVGPLHRFIPWGLAGFAINVVTGMLFFVAMPYFYVLNLDFHFKMVAIVLAGVNLLIYSTGFTRSHEEIGANQDAPVAAKFLAATSLVLWIAVIVFGRYMPLFEESLAPTSQSR